MRNLPCLSTVGIFLAVASVTAAPFPITTNDLATEKHRQVIVDRETGQYLGHPTTVLLEDGKTILTVHPKGHGKGGIVYKRSIDGGLTWSDRLHTPASWATSKEVPALHRVVDAAGKKRLIMWSGLYPARLAVSEDDGKSWGELTQVGDWGGIVVMGFTEPLKMPGHYLAMFHDDGRYFTSKAAQKKPVEFTLFKTFSRDGGFTWSAPEAVQQDTAVHLCEHGEWLGYLHRDGRLSSRAKGTIYKGPFHLPRMLWYCWQWLESSILAPAGKPRTVEDHRQK